MRYGIFNGERLTRFSNATDLNKLAIIYMKWVLKQDGLEPRLTKDNIKEYLEGWVEWSKDTEEPFESVEFAIDTAHDILTYSNIHFMKGNVEINQDEKEIVSKKIYEILSK